MTELTKEQDAALNHLMEECAEVIKACSKIRRFGPKSYKEGKTRNNLTHLIDELQDIEETAQKVIKEFR